MRFQRAVSVLALVSFLPLAFGCSKQTTNALDTDLGGPNALLSDEQPVRIAGYTDHEGQFHEWEGEVQAVLPDSLLFTRDVPDGYWPHPDSTFRPTRQDDLRLHRSDVLSVELVEANPDGTSFLLSLFGVLVVTAVIVAIVVTQIDMEITPIDLE